MHQDDEDEQKHLAEVAQRLGLSRRRLAMTVYAIQHSRRTPDQVGAVLDRATTAIHRNQLVRRRWQQHVAVH